MEPFDVVLGAFVCYFFIALIAVGTMGGYYIYNSKWLEELVSPQYQVKINTVHYLRDPDFDRKVLRVGTGFTNECKKACNQNPNCTHFFQVKNGKTLEKDGRRYFAEECILMSGAVWEEPSKLGEVYCKRNCK